MCIGVVAVRTFDNTEHFDGVLVSLSHSLFEIAKGGFAALRCRPFADAAADDATIAAATVVVVVAAIAIQLYSIL